MLRSRPRAGASKNPGIAADQAAAAARQWGGQRTVPLVARAHQLWDSVTVPMNVLVILPTLKSPEPVPEPLPVAP
jgi:hypothetical protein